MIPVLKSGYRLIASCSASFKFANVGSWASTGEGLEMAGPEMD